MPQVDRDKWASWLFAMGVAFIVSIVILSVVHAPEWVFTPLILITIGSLVTSAILKLLK